MGELILGKRLKVIIIRYRTIIAAVVLLLLFAMMAWFVATRSNQKIVVATNNMLQLAEETRRYYHNRPDYWGLSTSSVIDKKIAPAHMISGNKLLNPLEAEFNIGSGADGAMIMPGTRSFDIAYQNLSKKDCIDLATYSLSEESKLGLLSITVNNSENETVFTWGGKYKLPISRENASHICQNLSNIIWNFE